MRFAENTNNLAMKIFLKVTAPIGVENEFTR